VTISLVFVAVAGHSTPWPGCKPTTNSFSAVLKIASSTTFALRIEYSGTFSASIRVIHCRTSEGITSIIRILPNSGSTSAYSEWW
jgi:hypothetical protein